MDYDFNLKEGRCILDIRKTFFTLKMALKGTFQPKPSRDSVTAGAVKSSKCQELGVWFFFFNLTEMPFSQWKSQCPVLAAVSGATSSLGRSAPF